MGFSAQIGEEVFARLNKVARLPSCGYAGGQSVCNAVLEIMGYGSYAGPYRDVDVFFRAAEGHEPTQIISETRSWLSALRGVGKGLEHAQTDYPQVCQVVEPGWDHDYDTLCFQSRRTHRVTRSWRAGKVNCIFVEAMDEGWSRQDLLHGMDLNCAQVGLDLKTKELFFTEEFVRFIGSKDIRIVNMAAPVSALLRCLSKRNDMKGTTADVERLILEIKLASLTHESWRQDDQPWRYDGGRFGVPTKHQKDVERFWEVLEPHFTRQAADRRQEGVTQLLLPKALPGSGELDVVERFSVLGGVYLKSWRVCSAALRGEVAGSRATVFEKLAEATAESCLGDAIALYGASFVGSGDTVDDVEWLVQFCRRRRGLGVHRFKRLRDWLTAARFIENAERAHGTWISSAMHQRSEASRKRSVSYGEQLRDEFSMDFVEVRGDGVVLVERGELDKRIGRVRPLIDRPIRAELALPAMPEGLEVRQLRTARDFFEVDYEFGTDEGWHELQRRGDQPRMFVVGWLGQRFMVTCDDDGKIARQCGFGHEEPKAEALLLGKNIRGLAADLAAVR